MQGVYNLLLAFGALWGVFNGDNQLKIMFTAFVWIAAVFGGTSFLSSIILKQVSGHIFSLQTHEQVNSRASSPSNLSQRDAMNRVSLLYRVI